jgi:hypothetical protein
MASRNGDSRVGELVPIVPSHQPFELEAIRVIAKAYPTLKQVAVFDTSFHRTMPEVAQRYALPEAILGEARYAPKARRVIAAHLGGSMCAILDGRSVDTSMGFSAIDGLPMATRCSTIDPQIPVLARWAARCSMPVTDAGRLKLLSQAAPERDRPQPEAPNLRYTMPIGSYDLVNRRRHWASPSASSTPDASVQGAKRDDSLLSCWLH